MKYLIPVLPLLLMLPSAAHAQLDILFEDSRPVVRANIAGLSVSATLGSRRGLDLRVDDDRMPRTRIPTRRTRTASAGAVLGTADAYVGTKYKWGGTTPSGFDCSGFVQYVFRRHGIELPRTSRQQAAVGQYRPAGLSALAVGDLMLFATNGRIDHIAIYAGGNEIIHSSASGGGVGYDNFTSKRGRYFIARHVATRRVLANGESLVGALTAALRAITPLDPPDRAPRR